MRRTLIVACALALAVPLAPATAGTASQGAAAPVDGAVADAEGRTSALVHAVEGAGLAGLRAAGADAGVDLGTVYPDIDVAVAYGTGEELTLLAGDPSVAYVEANAHITYYTDTSHHHTRGIDLLDEDLTLPDGTPIDGRGIGVAVVDSGIDSTHPDLADRVAVNKRVVCTAPGTVGISQGLADASECHGPKVFVDAPDTDLAGGHGTHVAGTVAGTGSASDGTYRGAAPGATIYGIAAGTTAPVENALDGLAWVLDNHDEVDPAIRVVNNSWGTDYAEADENDPQRGAITKMQNALIEAGVVVVFAAGNSGGDGSEPTTSHQCVNRTPGNICVAAWDDFNMPQRGLGRVASYSSRGDAEDPETWPSVMAPGSDITAACRLTMPVCSLGSGHEDDPPNTYASLQGTSMAAPHVAGIAAQVLQVAPDLEPADVQFLLQTTAFAVDAGAAYEPDPFGPDGGTSSFDKGHGLVDVRAAVEALLTDDET